MKLLLLGASGFVGSNLIGPLASENRLLHAACRSPGGEYSLPIDHAPAYDAIVSVAGIGDPARFESDPLSAITAETRIIDSIIRLARTHPVCRVLYLSTAGAAYGEGLLGDRREPFSENDECKPISIYGKSKVDAELHLREGLASIDREQSLIILRATNVYGRRYGKGGRQGLVNALLQRAVADRPITIFGDGLVYRDYLFADDLARAIERALCAPVSGVFNIGAGHSHSILEVISEVEEAMGYVFAKEFLPARRFDVKYSAVSIVKARDHLHWAPQVDLRTGIRMLLTTLQEEG